RAPSVRLHRAAVAEELLLAGRAVTRQDAVAGAFHVADAGTDAEAQPGPEAVAALERLEEQPAGVLEAAVGVGGRRIAAIDRAVEHADRVGHLAAGEVTLQLHADIAVGQQLAGQRSLDVRQRRGGLQALQAHRRGELAYPHGG